MIQVESTVLQLQEACQLLPNKIPKQWIQYNNSKFMSKTISAENVWEKPSKIGI